MTKLPQSTISFNTPEFLKGKLDTLVTDGKIQSYIYILHNAEEDTKKNHIHLLVVPSSTLNPVTFRKQFIEPSFNNRDLGCLPFYKSKISDWFLYALHYPPYLTAKGLTRVYNYNIEDFVTNECPEFLEQCFSEACESLVNTRIDTFLGYLSNGGTFGETLAQGLVPPNQVIFYEKLYKTYRKGGENLCNTNNDE